eukprot:gene6735-10900_t
MESSFIKVNNEEEYVWSFVYGTNMNPYLLTRRKIYPVEKIPAKIKNYTIDFFPNLPYMEPGINYIKKQGGSIMHGLLIKLTKQQFDILFSIEGTGDSKDSYNIVKVECETYQNETIQAFIFERKSSFNFSCYPSKRYLELIIKGAKSNNLNTDYIEELKSIPVYTIPTFKKVIAILFFSPLILLFMTIIMSVTISKKCFGLKNISVSNFSKNLIHAFWFVEKHVLKNFLGNGGKWNKN